MDTLPASNQSSRDNEPNARCETCKAPGAYPVQIFYPGVSGIPELALVCRDCEIDAAAFGAVVARVIGTPSRISAALDGLEAAVAHGSALIDSGVFRKGA